MSLDVTQDRFLNVYLEQEQMIIANYIGASMTSVQQFTKKILTMRSHQKIDCYNYNTLGITTTKFEHIKRPALI